MHFPIWLRRTRSCRPWSDSVDLSATPDQVWALIGPFGGMWHPLIAKIQVTGTGIGQLRTIETIDGKQIIERLEAIDDSQRLYRYAMISGIPAADYTGTLDVKPKGTGSSVEWRVQYLADGQPDIIVKTIVSTLLKTGLESLKARFGVAEMIEAPDLETDFPLATAGDIAVNNLESARQQSWSRFWQEPRRPGIAEYIVEQEQLAAQFLGDLGALDRLETLVNQLARVDAESMRTALIHAQVASMTHRFAEARSYLAQAEVRGAPPAAVNRLSLSIDQACGTRLDAVLEARRRMAAESGRLEDLVPLGALLADLREFDEADRIYRRALQRVPGCLTVRRGMGLLSAGRSVGRARTRTTIEPGRAVVSKSHRVSAVLCESARASGGDLFALAAEPRTRKPCCSRRLRAATPKCVGVSPM